MTAGGQTQEVQHGVKRKRASREGLPKRFCCQHPGCDKRYSRAEHLQRHALNHSSTPLYRCETPGCGQKFVRQDLFDRHVARHSISAGSLQDAPVATQSNEIGDLVSLTDSNAVDDGQATHPDRPTQSSLRGNQNLAVDATAMGYADWALLSQTGETSIADPAQSSDNLASWLLSPEVPHGWDFDLTPLLFSDYAAEPGASLANRDYLEASNPTIAPATDSPGILFRTANFEEDNLMSSNALHWAGRREGISEKRHKEIKTLILGFRCRNASNVYFRNANTDSFFFLSSEEDLPNVSALVLDQCIAAFWKNVAEEMPILHSATFSVERCPALLLLGIISLGAAEIVRRSAVGVASRYRTFADMIITSVRWEIYTHDDAQPPVKLWVAQALLFLEFYEKMYSNRQLHERAHIHHVSTLTLLRRGSPLGGQPGTEVPVDTSTSASQYPSREQSEKPQPPSVDTNVWWERWAKSESMLRVVFAAYEMDTLHAMMFGHESSLFPYDVGLPLPCDDALWTATSAEEVLGLETTFSMHGIKSMKFLDGLKKYLHGNDVRTHKLARQVLLVGLLNVGWHIRHQVKHMQLIDSAPAQEERSKWMRKVLRSLDRWKCSFLDALEITTSRRTTDHETRIVAKPNTLYRLAYITMHVDIIDCQILAGCRLLLGRHVSTKEVAGASSRAKTWIGSAEARVAVLHSFNLLWETLFLPYIGDGHGSSDESARSHYSSRSDHCVYRPWSLYLAALVIWKYNYTKEPNVLVPNTWNSLRPADLQQTVYDYVSKHANSDDSDTSFVSKPDCIALLRYLSDSLVQAEPQIFTEASSRLYDCCKLLCPSA